MGHMFKENGITDVEGKHETINRLGSDEDISQQRQPSTWPLDTRACEMFHYTWQTLHMSFRGNLFSRI